MSSSYSGRWGECNALACREANVQRVGRAKLVYPLGPPISMGGRVREPATPLGPPISMGGRVSRAWSTPSVPPYQWGEGFREPALPPPRPPHINGGKGSRAWSTPLGPPISMGGKVSRAWSTPLGPPISMGGRFSRAWSTPLGPPISMGGRFSRAWSTPLGPPISMGGRFREPGLPPSVPPYQWGEGFRRLGGVSGAEGCSRNLSVSGQPSCIAGRSIFPAMTRVSGGGRRMSLVVAVEALENLFCATCEISGSLNGGGADSVVKLHLMLVKHRLGMEG